MGKIFFFVMFILVQCAIICGSLADEINVGISAKEVVIKWTKVYGIDLDRASDLTTLEFREGMTKKDWASKYAPVIRSIEYKHMGRDIIAELTELNKSMVVMRSRIMTIAGGVTQIEIYELVMTDGKWLIDNISVKEESDFGGSGMDR